MTVLLSKFNFKRFYHCTKLNLRFIFARYTWLLGSSVLLDWVSCWNCASNSSYSTYPIPSRVQTNAVPTRILKRNCSETSKFGFVFQRDYITSRVSPSIHETKVSRSIPCPLFLDDMLCTRGFLSLSSNKTSFILHFQYICYSISIEPF